MDLIQFAYPERILLLWVVLIVIVLCGLIMHHRAKRLDKFMSPEMQAHLLTQASTAKRVIQIACLAVFGVLCVLALMRPQIVTKETFSTAKTSANMYVVLDVSKSMLAADVAPSRLDRAKSEIRDMLPAFAAHRVGLMAFAGRSTVLSPLTVDHGFFRLVLDSASPSSVTLGGTNIGDAIRKATKLLSQQEGPKAILLITDGEDHDSYPVEAAQEAKKAGVVIITVGFGSEQGTTIDVLDKTTGQKKRVLDSSGKEVISRLDGETLRKIALETDGVYVPASTKVLDLDGIMKRHILPLVEDVNLSNTREVRVELFQWFVFGALFFLGGYMLLESSWRKRRNVIKGVER